MLRITTAELKNNHEKYFDLAQRERIEVTEQGIVVFTMVPECEGSVEELKSYFGCLPKDATIGVDPYERG